MFRLFKKKEKRNPPYRAINLRGTIATHIVCPNLGDAAFSAVSSRDSFILSPERPISQLTSIDLLRVQNILIKVEMLGHEEAQRYHETVHTKSGGEFIIEEETEVEVDDEYHDPSPPRIASASLEFILEHGSTQKTTFGYGALYETVRLLGDEFVRAWHEVKAQSKC